MKIPFLLPMAVHVLRAGKVKSVQGGNVRQHHEGTDTDTDTDTDTQTGVSIRTDSHDTFTCTYIQSTVKEVKIPFLLPMAVHVLRAGKVKSVQGETFANITMKLVTGLSPYPPQYKVEWCVCPSLSLDLSLCVCKDVCVCVSV